MLLEYVLRTMEDDFRAKLSSAALNESIARAFLSCTTQFTKVRYVGEFEELVQDSGEQ